MANRRRYLISAAVLAACVCIAIGVLAILPQRPGVTKENFDRIEMGMTQDEVERLLGEPMLVIDEGPRRMTKYELFEENRNARIIFDEAGRVSEKTWFGWVPPTFAQRLKHWIILPSAD